MATDSMRSWATSLARDRAVIVFDQQGHGRRVDFSETSFDRPPELSGVRAAETAAASGIQQWPVGWTTAADTEDAQWLVVKGR
jgi:hypothetical protein